MEALDMLTKVIKETRPGGHHAVMDQLRDSMKARSNTIGTDQFKPLGGGKDPKAAKESALKEKLKDLKAKRSGGSKAK